MRVRRAVRQVRCIRDARYTGTIPQCHPLLNGNRHDDHSHAVCVFKYHVVRVTFFSRSRLNRGLFIFLFSVVGYVHILSSWYMLLRVQFLPRSALH